MRARRMVVGVGCVAVAIAALGGCGGSDDADDGTDASNRSTADGDARTADDDRDDPGDDGATDTDRNAETAGDEGDQGDDATGDDESDEPGDGDATGDDESDDPGANAGGDDDATGDDSDGAAGGGEYRCDDIFSMAEVEAWFGEPAELTEDRMDSIGQIVCGWATIEDPAATDDFAFQLITAQIFTGEGVPAESFIDPEIFEEVTMIDDVGDLAFYEESFGRSYYFLDGSIAGSFSVSEVDMGDSDAPKRHTADDVDALFRDFHARVMG